MTVRKVSRKIVVWLCECERCGHQRESVGPEKPTRCAGCKKVGWERRPRPYNREAIR